MEIQLKNIGMIKEANVKIDGLTVIAGENDTGKSTVAKALHYIVNFKTCQYENIFSSIIQEKNSIILKLDDGSLINGFNGKEDNFTHSTISVSGEPKLDSVFIETPLIWNFTDFFRDVAQIESQIGVKVDYPYLMKDLNFKLFLKNNSKGIDIKDDVTSLMKGEFKKDKMGRFFFDKNGQRISLLNTATGIKYFGLLQVLSQNNWLNKDSILILDEPEVHLHPKWQLKMAEVIVNLVKNDVKVLVNSHSPYMIEALQRYAEKEEITSDFYLAENGYIKKENENNSDTLAKIFSQLSEPFDEFEDMDSEKMEKFLNG